MDFFSASSAIGSVLTTINAARAALEARDYIATSGAISDAMTKLLEANNSLFAQSAKLAKLQEELRVANAELGELKRVKLDRDQYTLVQIADGSWVYRSKPVPEPDERGLDINQPLHYVCQGCFEKGTKFVLQLRGGSWHCPGCKTSYRSGPDSIGIGRARTMDD